MKKILEYLFYLFVFLLPWQTRWIIYDPQINGGVWEYGRMSIYSFDLVFISLMAIYFIGWLLKDKFSIFNFQFPNKSQISNFKIQKIFTLFLFIIFIFLNIIFSFAKILTIYWSLRLLQGVLLVWLMSKINFSKVKLALAFVVGVTLSAILGVYQFLTQSAFDSKWLGLAYHSASVLGDSVVETMTGRWLRAYGSLPHPNVLAGFCVIAIVLCWWLLDESLKQKNIKTLKQEEIKKSRISEILLVTGYWLLVTGLFFTFSRAAWLVFAVIIVILLFHCFITFLLKKKLATEIKNCVFIFLYFYIFIFLCFLYWPLVQTRITGDARLEIESNAERMSNYRGAWQIIKVHPWLGVGIGNYTVELQKMKPSQPAWAYQPVHNVYLLMMAELGIIGFAIIILLFYYFIILLKKLEIKNLSAGLAFVDKAGKEGQTLARNFIFLYSCIFIFLFLFDHFWWTLPSAMLLWWLGIGVMSRAVIDE